MIGILQLLCYGINQNFRIFTFYNSMNLKDNMPKALYSLVKIVVGML